MKKRYIISSVFIFSLIVTLVDAFIHPPYVYKIIVKILCFLVLPMTFFILYKEEWKEFRSLFRFHKKGILLSFLIGSMIYGIILGGYFLTRNIIDFSNVTSSLTNGMGITKENVFYVGIYLKISRIPRPR